MVVLNEEKVGVIISKWRIILNVPRKLSLDLKRIHTNVFMLLCPWEHFSVPMYKRSKCHIHCVNMFLITIQ